MENIIITILFVFPGIFVELLYKRFIPTAKDERSDFEIALIAFVNSAAILIINLMILRIGYNQEIITINQLQSKFTNINFLLKYAMLTGFSSIIFAFAWNKLYTKVILHGINKFRTGNNLPIETIYPTVWDEIFENKEIDTPY